MLNEFNFIIAAVSDTSKDLFHRNKANKETCMKKLKQNCEGYSKPFTPVTQCPLHPLHQKNVGMFTGRVCLSLMARSECAAMEKQEQRKLRRISAESHAVRRCAPGTRLTHCQSSREIAYSGS
jgi:hypothetical protein